MHSHSVVIYFIALCSLFTFTTASTAYGKHKLYGYIVDWDIPKNLEWSKVDHIIYSFAEPNKDGDLESITSSYLKTVVSHAHQHKVGVSISIGGWSGSKYISNLVSSSSKRSSFLKKIVAMVEKYNLDGVNMDWEYPNDPYGVACNIKNSKDTANYLIFLKDLRKALDAKYTKVHKVLTLAVNTAPFNDEHRNPTKKLSQDWANIIDSYLVMAYDISGSWLSTAGPNAPLKKASSKYYETSVEQAVQAWNSAGIPKSKLIIGLPFYGTVLKTSRAINSSTGLYVKLANPSAIKGDKYDELSSDPCSGAKKSYSGEYQWRSIVSAGINNNKNGWKSYWDKISVTPYAYHSDDKKFLTYDDHSSLKSKADYIKQQKLGGAMVWSLEMDDSKHTLLNSIQGVRD